MSTYGRQGGSGGGGSSSSSWFDIETAAHRADVPALTDSIPVVLGVSNVMEALGAGVADAGVAGAALKQTGAAFVSPVKANVWLNSKTDPWACSWQLKIGAIQPAKVSYIGIGNTAGNQLLLFAADPSRNATNFIFFGFNGANTTIIDFGVAADAANRSIRATSDGVNTKVYLDGVLKGTLVNGSEANYPTGCVVPVFNATAAYTGGQAIWNCLYSFQRT